ncbi:hypothetical protein BDP55DRAFT_631239 [Colletotrichum godetiae]|uniref:Uncharacterized protein n=1 Tax=Colletotrichum godetiae TaxID=1209918 RepID=A0AAJ0EWR5_9PEZI|nr:uncharacterized protein BDP55DRAFT_631239 [Colletotrichum godetiae]KAK1676613.1 hypothetical protein BDP55DRAFT_631239 [Colletotrichum godetiae]
MPSEDVQVKKKEEREKSILADVHAAGHISPGVVRFENGYPYSGPPICTLGPYISRCHTGLTLYDVRGPPQLRAGPLVPQAGPRTINRNPAAAAGEAGGEETSDDRAARGPFFPVFVCVLGAGILYLAETLHMQPQNVCQLPTSHIPTRYGYTTYYTNPPLRNGGESGTKSIAICPPTRMHTGTTDQDTDPA